VHRFFKVELNVSLRFGKNDRETHRVHDRQVDCPPEVDEVGLGHVGDALLVGRNVLLIRLLRVLASAARLFVIRVTENLAPDLLVALLVLEEVGVDLEEI
jgi:hypothetical protein